MAAGAERQEKDERYRRTGKAARGAGQEYNIGVSGTSRTPRAVSARSRLSCCSPFVPCPCRVVPCLDRDRDRDREIVKS